MNEERQANLLKWSLNETFELGRDARARNWIIGWDLHYSRHLNCISTDLPRSQNRLSRSEGSLVRHKSGFVLYNSNFFELFIGSYFCKVNFCCYITTFHLFKLFLFTLFNSHMIAGFCSSCFQCSLPIPVPFSGLTMPFGPFPVIVKIHSLRVGWHVHGLSRKYIYKK